LIHFIFTANGELSQAGAKRRLRAAAVTSEMSGFWSSEAAEKIRSIGLFMPLNNTVLFIFVKQTSFDP